MDMIADVSLVLDCSTSMGGIRRITVQGVNALIRHQKSMPSQKVFSLLTFSNQIVWQRVAAPISDIQELTDHEYELTRGTRLLDAIGETIQAIEKRLSGSTNRRVLVAIMTDGMEHCSRNFSRGQIFKLILNKRRNEHWEFLFLGANQNSIQSAANLGIPPSHALNFNAVDEGVKEATGLLNKEITKFSTGMTTGFYPTQCCDPIV